MLFHSILLFTILVANVESINIDSTAFTGCNTTNTPSSSNNSSNFSQSEQQFPPPEGFSAYDRFSVYYDNHEIIYERVFDYDIKDHVCIKTVIYDQPDPFEANTPDIVIDTSFEIPTCENATTGKETEPNNQIEDQSPEIDYFKDFNQEQRRETSKEIEQENFTQKQRESVHSPSRNSNITILKEEEFPEGVRVNLGDPFIFDSDIILQNVEGKDLLLVLMNKAVNARFKRRYNALKKRDLEQRRRLTRRNKPLYGPQLSFLEALLSGKVVALVKKTHDHNLETVETAWNELKALWPWKRDHTFLISSRKEGTGESNFTNSLGINILKIIERDIITRPDFINKYITDNKSQLLIEEFKSFCINAQKNDFSKLFEKRSELHNKINSTNQTNLTDTICLALIEKALHCPFNKSINVVKHAHSLQAARKEIEAVEKHFLQYAKDKNIKHMPDLKKAITDQYNFDVLQALYEAYRARMDYQPTAQNQTLWSHELACTLANIQSLPLPMAHAELLHAQRKMKEAIEKNNKAHSATQQENQSFSGIQNKNSTLCKSTFKERPDFLDAVKLFKPLDVPYQTADILFNNKDYDSVSRSLEEVAKQVFFNAKLCELDYVPQVENCITHSLEIIKDPQNNAEFIFHINIVDHLLSDVQSHAHAIIKAEPTVWERSPELLTRAITQFITALNPIEQAKDMGSLIKDCLWLTGKGLVIAANAVLHPLETADTIATARERVCEFIGNTARLTADSAIGMYYLSAEERSQRITAYCNKAGDIYKYVESKVTAEIIVDITARLAADVLFFKGFSTASKFLKEIGILEKLSEESKLVSQGIKAAFAEQPTCATAEGIVLKMSNGLKDIGSKNNPIKSITKDVSKSGGRIMQENGKAFEDFLVKKLGGTGSFKVVREFDGAVGNVWYEAKSGGYWDMLLSSKDKLEDFKSSMGHRLKITNENGKIFQLHSNTPIPQEIKEWLTQKNISYVEWL